MSLILSDLGTPVNKDHAYHQIALACLKTLQSSQSVSAQDQAHSLYEAIDQAFESQMALVLAELDDCKQRLASIRALQPEHHALGDAHDIIDANQRAH